ncbi:uncharacterized protein [Clytia hemisphaerica]|uniref:Cnidarian restricted protein n=1 Tax=Clytia hemisphaerica TaxID=252671 RepID=A0A7M5USV2_9CNID
MKPYLIDDFEKMSMKWMLVFLVLFSLWNFRPANAKSYNTPSAKPTKAKCWILVKRYGPGTKITTSIRSLLTYCWRAYKIRLPTTRRKPSATIVKPSSKLPARNSTTPPKKTTNIRTTKRKLRRTPIKRRTTSFPVRQKQNDDSIEDQSKTVLYIGLGVACGVIILLCTILLIIFCKIKKLCCWKVTPPKDKQIPTIQHQKPSIKQNNNYAELNISGGTIDRSYATLNVDRDRLYTEINNGPPAQKGSKDKSLNHYEIMSDSMKNVNKPSQESHYEIPNDGMKIVTKEGQKIAVRSTPHQPITLDNGVEYAEYDDKDYDNDYIDLTNK